MCDLKQKKCEITLNFSKFLSNGELPKNTLSARSQLLAAVKINAKYCEMNDDLNAEQ
jgi:hypothetical protein